MRARACIPRTYIRTYIRVRRSYLGFLFAIMSVWYALLVIGAGVVFIQAKTECRQFEDNIFYEFPYFDSAYSYLYLKLEETLINDQKTLDSLRAGFISMGENSVVGFYDMHLEVVNGINDTCDGDWYDQKTFCANSNDSSMWELCDQYGLDMTFSAQSFDVEQAKNDNSKISRNILWLSLVHGSITSLFLVVNSEFEFNQPSDFNLSLRINELKCNPTLLLTKCVLSELFGWVSIVIAKPNNNTQYAVVAQVPSTMHPFS